MCGGRGAGGVRETRGESHQEMGAKGGRGAARDSVVR